MIVPHCPTIEALCVRGQGWKCVDVSVVALLHGLMCVCQPCPCRHACRLQGANSRWFRVQGLRFRVCSASPCCMCKQDVCMFVDCRMCDACEQQKICWVFGNTQPTSWWRCAGDTVFLPSHLLVVRRGLLLLPVRLLRLLGFAPAAGSGVHSSQCHCSPTRGAKGAHSLTAPP